MSLRLRSEQGFGLIELLMAMVMLNIGILAIVAAFNSGMFAMNRASRISTASALADSQMELYRSLVYDSITLDSTSLSSVDNTYKCDSALGASCPNSTGAEVQTVCSGPPIPVQPEPLRHRCRSQGLPDRHVHHVGHADRRTGDQARHGGRAEREGPLGAAVRTHLVDIRRVDR